MTKKTSASREAKSTNRSIRIRLSQINIDATTDFCHRSKEALDVKALKLLAESLVYEGQHTPLTVYDSGKKDLHGEVLYVLIGGFRRYHALKTAIKQKLDVDRIHRDMEVDAVEVVQGDEQEGNEYQKDLLLRSVTENEQRKNFTTEEKLEIVKLFRERDVPDPRAASAMSISETQYGRFVSVVEYPWLHQYVVDNCIGMTDAAELIKAAEKAKWVKEFEADLTKWVNDHLPLIEQERRELAKINKKLSGSAEHVKKFIDRNLVKHWATLIEQNKRFDGDVHFKFGIVIDKQKGTITIPGSTYKVTELTSSNFDVMIGELHDAIDNFLPLMRERRVIEEATSLSEKEKHRELLRILEERKRQKQIQEQEYAGRVASDFDAVDHPVPTTVDVEDRPEAEGDDVEPDGDGNATYDQELTDERDVESGYYDESEEQESEPDDVDEDEDEDSDYNEGSSR